MQQPINPEIDPEEEAEIEAHLNEEPITEERTQPARQRSAAQAQAYRERTGREIPDIPDLVREGATLGPHCKINVVPRHQTDS